ncbi:zinc ribbon-containing protein [Shigella flexneri]
MAGSLLDITDKTQLEWRECLRLPATITGVSQWGSGGVGNPVCEKCHYHLAGVYAGRAAALPKCGHDQFQRRPFEP